MARGSAGVSPCDARKKRPREALALCSNAAPYPTRRLLRSRHLVSWWRRPMPSSVRRSNPSFTMTCTSAVNDTRRRRAGGASDSRCSPLRGWRLTVGHRQLPLRLNLLAYPAAPSSLRFRLPTRWSPPFPSCLRRRPLRSGCDGHVNGGSSASPSATAPASTHASSRIQ